MPAYIIANIDVTDPAAYEPYKEMAATCNRSHGSRYLARGGRVEVLEGDCDAKRIAIATPKVRPLHHGPVGRSIPGTALAA
ncbi:MAG: DUF1330 domain-containing protein [Gaiellales bacterium]|nr:DUF1330 domain-containing protein [Gaiellales bacterium]